MALKQEFDVNLCSNVEIKEEWDIEPTVLQHTNNILTEPVEKQVYKIKNEIGFGSSEIVCNSIKSEYDSNGGISNASHFIPDHSEITIFTGEEYFKEDAGGRKLENVKVSIMKKSSIFEMNEVSYACEAVPGQTGVIDGDWIRCTTPYEEERRTSAAHDSESSLNSVTTHLGVQLDGKRFSCDVCLAKFRRVDKMTSPCEGNPGQMGIGDGNWLSCRTFREEEERVSAARDCKSCASSTAQIEIRPDGKQFSCDICVAKFRRTGHLAIHKFMTTLKKPSDCEICNVKLRQSKKRKLIHTGQKQIACEMGNMKTKKLQKLEIDIPILTGEKPFSCELCNVKFTHLGSFTKHELTHTVEKPFHCRMCNAKFTRSGSLTRHKLIHTGEKPFRCKICNAKFTQIGILTRHHTIHTGEKPYSCEICNAKFTRVGSLTRHKLTHTGQKPFRC